MVFQPFHAEPDEAHLSKKNIIACSGNFLNPMMEFFFDKAQNGENWVLYDAPLAMYFYGNPYTDPVDQYIPATYAMLAAESLGLGSCMIGSIGPFITHGAKDLKCKYGIYQKNQQGVFVIFGYPKYKFRKAVKRSFAEINYF